MTMPGAEIDIILKRLDTMEAARVHDTERLHDKLDALKSNGCSHAPAHADQAKDHEQRIRTVETYQARQTGQVAVIAGGISVGSAVVIALGKWILSRIGAHG